MVPISLRIKLKLPDKAEGPTGQTPSHISSSTFPHRPSCHEPSSGP